MNNPAGFSFADTPRRKIMVISHERSGTHFLMNTLALNFGYIANPWLNLDYEKGINFHAPAALMAFFRHFHDRSLLNVTKSHHQIGFLLPLLEYLAGQFHIFYIYRDPRDVMTSFWKLISSLGWDEGPRTATVGDFMRAAPRGGILRYQKEQSPTILHRWQDHIDGWLTAAETAATDNIHLVSYEALSTDFDNTVKRIAHRLGAQVSIPVQPRKGEDSVLPGPGMVGRHREFFTPDDDAFMEEVAGDTMRRMNNIKL